MIFYITLYAPNPKTIRRVPYIAPKPTKPPLHPRTRDLVAQQYRQYIKEKSIAMDHKPSLHSVFDNHITSKLQKHFRNDPVALEFYAKEANVNAISEVMIKYPTIDLMKGFEIYKENSMETTKKQLMKLFLEKNFKNDQFYAVDANVNAISRIIDMYPNINMMKGIELYKENKSMDIKERIRTTKEQLRDFTSFQGLIATGKLEIAKEYTSYYNENLGQAK